MDFRQFVERVKLAWTILRGHDGEFVDHAKREVEYMRTDSGDSPDDWMANHIIDMVRVFSVEGHSGSSAPHAIGCLEKILSFKPLLPLTGDESEWGEPINAEGTRQNKRYGGLFINADGSAYDINGVVFREPGGGCWTGRFSKVTVQFPYTPKTIYVDIPLGASDEELLKAREEALKKS